MTPEIPSKFEAYDKIISALRNGELTPDQGRDYVYRVSHVFRSLLGAIQNDEGHKREPEQGYVERLREVIQLVPSVTDVLFQDEPKEQRRIKRYLKSRNNFQG